MTEFNGTNPLLDALGDQPTIRDVTINNNTSFKIVEPLTGLQIQTETIVRVHGEVAFQQIQNNIVQLNELKQQEAVTSTDVIVNEQNAQWILTNCAISNGILSYTGGIIENDIFTPPQSRPAFFAEKDINVGDEHLFIIKPSTCKSLIAVIDSGVRSGNWSEYSAALFERPEQQVIQLFKFRGAPQEIIDTSSLLDEYQISMKLVTETQVEITVRDNSNQQVLGTLFVDGNGILYKRIWLEVEFDSSDSVFDVPFLIEKHNQQVEG